MCHYMGLCADLWISKLRVEGKGQSVGENKPQFRSTLVQIYLSSNRLLQICTVKTFFAAYVHVRGVKLWEVRSSLHEIFDLE